jgi:phenylalanyl-tRNA synthetase alpha chain
MQLPTAQAALLRAASADEAQTLEYLAAEADLAPETATGAAFELAEAGLLSVTEESERTADLTEEGREYLEVGLPEVRLYRAAREAGADDSPAEMGAVIGAADLAGPEVDIALSNYARKSYGTVESGEITADPGADPGTNPEAAALAAIAGEADADTDPEVEANADPDATDVDAEILDALERRGLIEIEERPVRRARLPDAGITTLAEGIEAVEGIDRLTPELLTSGDWEEAAFASYNVEADAEEITPGKTHVLRGMAERVKDVLVGMGFQEMEGPHVDADFWINDCLFMPQDHPARTHWDRFALAEPSHIADLPADLVERVEDAHRHGIGPDGEGYHSPWDEDFARALAFRGHTTSLSVRYLSGLAEGELDPPQRYFSVEKVYRNDTLDATHLLEFFQIEGWVMAEDLSVPDLMGTFEEFYRQFGITDLEFKPHYNPYTEPSFELFGRHPTTGELLEIGNSGMFRPEMLDPLGVDCDVMAWGLALERLLMLVYGFEDIRDVHGTLCDLEFLRNAEVQY